MLILPARLITCELMNAGTAARIGRAQLNCAKCAVIKRGARAVARRLMQLGGTTLRARQRIAGNARRRKSRTCTHTCAHQSLCGQQTRARSGAGEACWRAPIMRLQCRQRDARQPAASQHVGSRNECCLLGGRPDANTHTSAQMHTMIVAPSTGRDRAPSTICARLCRFWAGCCNSGGSRIVRCA